ncbi:MAG: hypothetical protein C0614_00085, partial [Desulfuromonas sp.]
MDSVVEPVKQEPIELKIGGMSCVNCARNIEKGVATLEGVTSARVNFAAERLVVTADPQLVSVEQLSAKVKELGFRVVTGDQDSQADRRERNWLIFSALLSLPIMPLMWLMPFGNGTIWLIALLSSVVQFTAGLTFYRGAFNSLRNGT